MSLNFEEDAAPQPASEDSLKRVIRLAKLFQDQAAAVVLKTKELEAAQAAFTKTEREDLPDLMRELGAAELKLPDGSLVSSDEAFTASVSAERMPQVVAWLKKQGHDGIVKTMVSVAFGRGEAALATKVLDFLIKKNLPAQRSDGIHYQTLQAYVKEQREAVTAGKEGALLPPDDLFGIFKFNKAKIKAPPKPKAGTGRKAAPAK